MSSFLTYSDTVDQILDQVVGGDASVRNLRQAKRAVAEAVEELCFRRDWRYYYRPDLIETVAPYSTGTITYTAATRTVTLASGTWPTDADDYALIVNSTRYGVESRTSGTVIILRDGDCPTADIAAGTSYTLVKDSYLLPEQVRKIDYLYDTLAPGRMIPQTSPDSILRERRLVRSVSFPLMYSVFRHEKYHGRMAIHFAPSCSTDRQYAYMAVHRPLLPTIYQVGSATTATVSAASTTVTTSVASTLTATHTGCVIRFGDVSNAPTGPYGYVDGSLSVAAFETILQTYLTTTTFSMESAPTTALTTVKYQVSSLIDIAPTMRNALLRLAEAKFSPTDRKGYPDRLAEYERAYNIAAWADQTMQNSPGTGFIPTSLADVALSSGQP